MDAERSHGGSAIVADPSLRASERQYGSVSRVRSGGRDTSAADPPRSPFAVWVCSRNSLQYRHFLMLLLKLYSSIVMVIRMHCLFQ